MKIIKSATLTVMLLTVTLIAGVADSPKSTGARLAKAKYDKTLSNARRAYMKAIEDARKVYIKELEGSLTKAMRSNNLNEANRINTVKNEMNKQAAHVGSYTWHWKDKPDGVLMLWPDGSAMLAKKDNLSYRMNWRAFEDDLVIYSSKHQYHFDPIPTNRVLQGIGTVPSIRIKLVRK